MAPAVLEGAVSGDFILVEDNSSRADNFSQGNPGAPADIENKKPKRLKTPSDVQHSDVVVKGSENEDGGAVVR